MIRAGWFRAPNGPKPEAARMGAKAVLDPDQIVRQRGASAGYAPVTTVSYG